MIQDLSGSWCIKRTGESMTRVDSPVLLMHYDPDRSWISDPDPDHPKGSNQSLTVIQVTLSVLETARFNFMLNFKSLSCY